MVEAEIEQRSIGTTIRYNSSQNSNDDAEDDVDGVVCLLDKLAQDMNVLEITNVCKP